jgi:hypothetical protein
MTKWEYYTNFYPNLKNLVDVLNSLGQDGWELICLEGVNDQLAGEQMKWFAVFKKPRA